MNPLLDKHFIELLDKYNEREIYAKIVSLTLDELPVDEISGKVSQGSLSIDGTSSIRRTCSLTIVSDRVDINEYYWSFTTKFKLYIGLKVPDYIRNQYQQETLPFTDIYTDGIFLNGELTYPYEAYPDIIWFPQGIFLITNFKLQINSNSTDNIYITGKDKMALLNGELGGCFPHAVDFKYQSEVVYNEIGEAVDETLVERTIPEIIQEMIHKYANEPFHNIILKDLIDGLELLDYHGDNDIYLLKNVATGIFEIVLFDGDVIRYDVYGNKVIIKDIPVTKLDTLSSRYVANRALKVKATNSLLDKTYYTVVKCSYGSVVGYRNTKLTYNEKELIANAGDTVTSVLDKLIQMLSSEYEYFYDLEGRFVFQKKLTYINTSWNSLTKADIETESTVIARSNLPNEFSANIDLTNSQLEEMTYSESTKLVSQVQYSFVGGTTTTAFSNTPDISKIKNDYSIWGKRKAQSTSKENAFHLRAAIDEKPESYVAFDGTTYTSEEWDWRELIYQMAVDYYQYNHDDDFEVRLSQNNPNYKFGLTGYEQYYEDMLGFWRQLYNPYPPQKENYESFGDDQLSKYQQALDNYKTTYVTDQNDDRLYWNKIIFENPSQLNFWFDFISSKGSTLNKYSVKAIGDRTKVVNEDDIKAIYYGEIPNLIYITQEEYEELINTNLINDGYVYVILPDGLSEYFDITRQNKSAQDKLDNLLFEYAYCNETISLTTIPIYHLTPNTKISIYDEKSKVNGEYIIQKITVPLNYNGTMTISATRAPIRIY